MQHTDACDLASKTQQTQCQTMHDEARQYTTDTTLYTTQGNGGWSATVDVRRARPHTGEPRTQSKQRTAERECSRRTHAPNARKFITDMTPGGQGLNGMCSPSPSLPLSRYTCTSTVYSGRSPGGVQNRRKCFNLPRVNAYPPSIGQGA